jgi:putative hydrolase of HD superfamily
MEKIIDFLIEVGKLKKIPRRGWILRGVKEPETVAAHTFRTAIMTWLLARPGLNIEKVIKIALVHELAKTHAKDVTPYDKIISQKKGIKKIFKEYPPGFKKEKEKIFYRDYKGEYKALKKLIRNLPIYLRKELFNLWDDYQRGLTEEGRLTRQVDQIENLLQGLEYWGKDKSFPIKFLWRDVKLIIDQPTLLNFLDEIDKKSKGRTVLRNILDFLIKINKLKQIPRTGLVFRQIKNPETTAEQTFRTATMVWVLGKRTKINMEKALKMALCHEICEVYAGDATPYDRLLPRPREELKEMFLNPSKFSEKEREKIIEYLREMYKIWPKFPKKEKDKIFQEDYQDEKKALERLSSKLPPSLKNEIMNLWDDFKWQISKEGKFVNQVYWIQTYFQALEYLKEDPKFPIRSWREQMIQIIDYPILLEFFKELEEKFLSKRKIIF